MNVQFRWPNGGKGGRTVAICDEEGEICRVFSGDADVVMIRVVLPYHLRNLAQVGAEVEVDVQGAVTQRTVIDAVEARWPVLRGTIRDHTTKKRRPFLRFFACEEDLSHEELDAPLPNDVATGREPYLVVGAIAGG